MSLIKSAGMMAGGQPENGGNWSAVDSIFAPVAAALQKDVQHPVFFISLVPNDWSVQYFGLPKPERPDAECEIDGHLQALIKALERSLDRGPDLLDRFFEDHIKPHLGDPNIRAQLTEWALKRLHGRRVPLGWEDSSSTGSSIWGRQNEGNQPLLWFQDALEWACRHQFNLEGFLEGRNRVEKEVMLYSNHLMSIPQYLSWPGLVNPRTAEAFVAEVLLYNTYRDGTSPCLPTELDHWFVPLAGLGQWRAAACWLSPHATPPPPFTLGEHSAFQQLLSQALIDLFVDQLGRVIQSGKKEQLPDAFSVLWWSELPPRVFSSQGDLTRNHPLSQGNNAFLKIEKEGELCNISMDFNAIHPELQARIGTISGFDRVEFKIRLFDESPANLRDLAPRHQSQLQMRLSSLLRQHAATADTTKALLRLDIEDAAIHMLKNSITITRWKESLAKLRKVEGQAMEATVKHAIREAQMSLASCFIVEGMGNLLRLKTIVEGDEWAKLESWTALELLERWQDRDPAILGIYAKWVGRFSALVCFGNSYHHGFKLVLRGHRTVTSTTIDTAQVPEGTTDTMETWWENPQPMVPLSLREVRSHIALLSTLIEPLLNATEALRRAPREGSCLIIEMIDRLPQEITVRILNTTYSPPEGLAKGIKQLQTVLDGSQIASVRSDDRPYDPITKLLAVEIALHPQKLADSILRATRRR